MRLWWAVLVLRLPRRQDSRRRRDALGTVLRAADSGTPRALGVVTRVMESEGAETVWRAWLGPTVSGRSSRRWASPLLTQLSAGSDGAVPDLVVNAAWHDWLDEHHASLWSLLERWNRTAPDSDPQRCLLSRLALGDESVPLEPRLLAGTALRFDHPVGERARARLLAPHDTEVVDLFCAAAPDVPEAIAFCVAHRLAPSDEVRRAVFFVRTEQHEQYRALDPDGTLLALGYRSAPADERSALRTAITALGGIDTLRVLAGQRSRQEDLASLDEQERAYLIQQLKAQGDWDRLWRFTLLLPLAEAVRTVRALGAWRPSGEDDLRVFEALRAADPQTVDGLMNAQTGVPVSSPAPHTRIRLNELDKRLGGIADLDFAPDGTQLALVGVCVGTEGEGVLSGEPLAWAGIVDLGSRTLSRLHCDFTYPLDWVAHLGSDTMVVAEADPYAVEVLDFSHEAKIHYVDRAGVRALDTGADEICGLERIAGDRAFVASAIVDDPDTHERPVLFIGGPDGSLADSGILDGLADDPRDFEPLIAAVDPDRRLVAMVDVLQDGVVADLRSSVVHTLDDGSETLENVPVPPAALSPSILVSCSEEGDLKVWHEPLTSTEPSMTIPAWSAASPPTALAWSPVLNRFLAVDVIQGPHLELLDVPPTRDSPVPDELVSERMALASNARPAPTVRLSPAGDVLAVGDAHGTVDLYDLTTLTLRALVARPMGLMTHQDLAQLAAVPQDPLPDDESRPVLALLRACLEHRFRYDVGIGETAGTAVAGAFEIELGEDGEG